jgi:hypothetical protein
MMKRLLPARPVLLVPVLAVLVVTGLVGCDSGGSNDGGPTAQVRFLHASPGAGDVTISADGNEVTSGLSFRREFNNPSITDYLDVPADAAVEVQSGGGTVLASVAADQLAADQKYTVIVAGDPADGSSAPQAIVLSDELPQLGSGEVGLRFVNASAAAGAADLFQVPPGGSTSASNRIASGVAFTGTFPASGAFDVRSVPGAGFVWTVPTSAGNIQFPVNVSGQASLSTGRHATAIVIDTEAGAGFPVAGLVQVE